jgi:hypothetical protein
MSAARAAAIVPNALSFPRATMHVLVRDRYRVDKLRFDLDAEGRGEILYRLVGGGWTFHFFLVSQKLPEAAKTDRNYAQSWDAMGVLCQGDWSAEREAHLRREVPKQRAGYADYDTLIYARGNRSARVFDHVVDSLAEGRQPDLALVAPIGYILRTTAFIGNGQLGTRPLLGFEPDHPLRRPYHAQFCSAFMLREYVFDLVDHIARARSPNAARLAPAYRRYLGLGNSAATGLAAFVANHPHLMHQWSIAYERALALAKERPFVADDARRFAALLDKAIRYQTEGARPSDGVFATPQSLAAELARVREAFADAGAEGSWRSLCEWAERHASTETCEILNSIALELYPDIADRFVDAFAADERFEIVPEMTVAELRERVRADYGWAVLAAPSAASSHYFWYRATAAPRDVRRGLRGREAGLEAETTMDTVLMVQRLWECLADADDDAAAAAIVDARPDLRHIVARVQSLAGCGYAELRQQMLAHDFSPFATIRFALSFFGMEKFEAAPPKSVRGVFMQGAPIAEDVAAGRDGDWPFPLLPQPEVPLDLALLAPLPVSRATSFAPLADGRAELRIAPGELARMVQTALQGHGAALGVAEDAAVLVTFAQARGDAGIATLLRHCEAGNQSSSLLAAPAALDLACAHALASGIGTTMVTAVRDPWLAQELTLRAARRGLVGVLCWHDEAGGGYAVAGPGSRGSWFACGRGPVPADFLAEIDALHAKPLPVRSFRIACVRPTEACTEGAALAALASAETRWGSAEVDAQRAAWLQRGIAIARVEFDALAVAGRALLVPETDEPRVLADGMDPWKSF